MITIGSEVHPFSMIVHSFAGAYLDPTGLIYMINRYYDPTTGQFLTIDPKVDQTGEPYAYVGGNPVNHIDANGNGGIGMSPATTERLAKLAAAEQKKCEQTPSCANSGLISGIAHIVKNGVTEVKSHWRGITQIAITVGGELLIATCTVASAGLCGVVSVVAGAEIPVGTIEGAALIGAGEGAAKYAVSSGSHTLRGYANEIVGGSVTGEGASALEELTPFAEAGAHSAAAGFFGTLLHFWF